ncbi:DUF2231 domain-containing protein [Longimicrobium sp.]|uniref:DUF2231 domain-containing protein n=1 Tax=Longimicrobium sp. TaxID=2029185 RepID=UPI002E326167|nr:DUF2231 domain-containing protein [Longimicrobium sp.]HEX6040011.1 DUF2231 domain-containing protein [Longimicrobium sp.]
MSAHLFVVHFPVALLLTGAAADLAGAVLRSDRVRAFAGVLLVLGGAAAFVAFFTGGGALAAVLSRVTPGDPRLEAHQQWGAAGVWVLAGAAALRAAWRRRPDGVRGWIALAAALVSAVLVVFIALSGAAISHG